MRQLWKKEETETLLKLIRETKSRELKSDVELSQELKIPMAKLGYERTTRQIREKIRLLRTNYLICQSKGESPKSIRDCAHYNLLKDIYSNTLNKKVSKGSNVWTEIEMHKMLSIVDKLNHSGDIKEDVFDSDSLNSINDNLMLVGYNKTISQIRKALNTLKTKYFDSRRTLETSGKKTDLCPYYDVLHRLWHNEPLPQPEDSALVKFEKDDVEPQDDIDDYDELAKIKDHLASKDITKKGSKSSQCNTRFITPKNVKSAEWSNQETFALLDTINQLNLADKFLIKLPPHDIQKILAILKDRGFQKTTKQVAIRLKFLKNFYSRWVHSNKSPINQNECAIFNKIVEIMRSNRNYKREKQLNGHSIQTVKDFLVMWNPIESILDNHTHLKLVPCSYSAETVIENEGDKMVIDNSQFVDCKEIEIAANDENDDDSNNNNYNLESTDNNDDNEMIHENESANFEEIFLSEGDGNLFIDSLPDQQMEISSMPDDNSKLELNISTKLSDLTNIQIIPKIEAQKSTDSTANEEVSVEQNALLTDKNQKKKSKKNVIALDNKNAADNIIVLDNKDVKTDITVPAEFKAEKVDFNLKKEDTSANNITRMTSPNVTPKFIKIIGQPKLILKKCNLDNNLRVFHNMNSISNNLYVNNTKLLNKSVASVEKNSIEKDNQTMEMNILPKPIESITLDSTITVEKPKLSSVSVQTDREPNTNGKSSEFDNAIEKLLKHEVKMQKNHHEWMEKQFEIQRQHDANQRQLLLNELTELRSVFNSLIPHNDNSN